MVVSSEHVELLRVVAEWNLPCAVTEIDNLLKAWFHLVNFPSAHRRFQDAREARNAFFDSSRSRMAEVQTHAARTFLVHTEGVAGNESDVFIFERPSKKLIDIDLRRQLDPDEKTAARLGPACSVGKILGECAQHRITLE